MYLVLINSINYGGSNYKGSDPILLTESLEQAIQTANFVINDICKDSRAILNPEDKSEITPNNPSVIIFWDKIKNWDSYQEVIIHQIPIGVVFYSERNDEIEKNKN